jgi:hypothetical protein
MKEQHFQIETFQKHEIIYGGPIANDFGRKCVILMLILILYKR